MGHRVSVDSERHLVELTFEGDVPFEEEVEALEDVISDDRYRPGASWLVDRRASRMLITPAQVQEQLDKVEAEGRRLCGARMAHVVTALADFGLLRMTEQLAAGRLPNELAVFRDIDEARAWLGVDGEGS